MPNNRIAQPPERDTAATLGSAMCGGIPLIIPLPVRPQDAWTRLRDAIDLYREFANPHNRKQLDEARERLHCALMRADFETGK